MPGEADDGQHEGVVVLLVPGLGAGEGVVQDDAHAPEPRALQHGQQAAQEGQHRRVPGADRCQRIKNQKCLSQTDPLFVFAMI